MGWLFYTDPSRARGHAGERAEITRLTTYESEDVAYEPIQLSKVSSTWYAAVRKRPLNGVAIAQGTHVPAPDGSIVFAAIFLVRRDRGCFGYKDMDECAGPNEARAPMSLIRRLSPLVPATGDTGPNLYDPRAAARDWRARCAAHAAGPRYRTGDVIALARPIPLSDGTWIRTVRKISTANGGRTRSAWVDVATGQVWRLTRAHLAGATRVSGAAETGTPVLEEFAARQRGGGRMIRVTYHAIDGYSETRSFAAPADARAWAVRWIGPHPEIGTGYAVSGDGVGRITATGIAIAALFAPDAERNAEGAP